MHPRFPSPRRSICVIALAVGLASVACSDGGPDSSLVEQFLDAVSGGSTSGTRRPGIPPRSGGGGGIIAEFINRAKPGATSQVVVHSDAPVARIIVAIDNVLNYYEIIPPSPFLDVGSAESLPTDVNATSAARTTDVVVSLQFAAAPPMPVFNLRIAAGSTADGPVGEYTSVTVDLSDAADPQIGLTPATLSFTGVENGALPPSSKVTIGNPGTGTLNRLSLGTIAFSPGGTPWLSVALEGQTAPTAATVAVTTTKLAPGTYNASVPVQSPAARETPRNFTVTYVVTPAPDPKIGLTPATLSFTAVQRGTLPSASKVAIDNSGTGTLDRLSIGTIAFSPAGTAWLSVALQGQVAPTSATVTVTTTNLAVGTYNASVPVQSPAAQETPRNFNVTYVVTAPPPPSIVLSSESIEFRAAMRGTNPPAQAVNVTNGGGGTLSGLSLGPISFTPSTTTVWLTAAIDGTTAPTSVQLRASVFNLVRGTYTATVPVRTSTPNVQQKLIEVRFVVD